MKKILLVEDDKKLASLIQSYLIEQGYHVTHEVRGDKAVYRIIKNQPDIVILDIALPGLDGLQVCASIRPEYRGMILMLTISENNDTQILGLNSGADDYVIKPILPKVLAARLEALSRRNQLDILVKDYKFGTLQINLLNHAVTLAGKAISLKPKEFELLKFLAANADKIVDRDSIMLALNGTHYDGNNRNIDLRISYLRKKLLDDNDNPFRIKTIRSKGYIFLSGTWN